MKFKNKILFFVALFSLSASTFGQVAISKTLYVVDSIPIISLLFDEEVIMQEDIDYISVVKDKDSLNNLGFIDVDSIVYIFTKEYKIRPDSIRKIPSKEQMEIKHDTCFFHGIAYSGRFITYYKNGTKREEGTCLNGKLISKNKFYYKNGNLALEIDSAENLQSNGIYNSHIYFTTKSYYANGQIRGTDQMLNGKMYGEGYFLNGQVSIRMSGDTTLRYYSSGRLKEKFYIDYKNRKLVSSLGEVDVLMRNPIKEDNKTAIKRYSKIIALDSTYADGYACRGIKELDELNYKAAIADFDKALEIEPFYIMASCYRVLARLKKLEDEHFKKRRNKYQSKISKPDFQFPISDKEKEILCYDLQQVEQGFEIYSYWRVDFKLMREAMWRYCHIKSKVL